MTSHNVIVTFLSDETAPDEYGGISFYAQSNYHVGDDDGEITVIMLSEGNLFTKLNCSLKS